MMNDTKIPMTYYSAFKVIEEAIHKEPTDYMIVSEGSNTMDIGRSILSNDQARQRLDAGTFGTMGVGFGFGIAAKAVYPNKKVIMVEGDSAFGFSAMELETAARYGLPLKVIIMNNNGIFWGVDELNTKDPVEVPPYGLSIDCRYDEMATIFGGKGAFVTTHEELKEKITEMLSDNKLWVLNVKLDPTSVRKP